MYLRMCYLIPITKPRVTPVSLFPRPLHDVIVIKMTSHYTRYCIAQSHLASGYDHAIISSVCLAKH